MRLKIFKLGSKINKAAYCICLERKLTFLFVFMLLGVQMSGQEYSYQIFVGNKFVGNMTVTRSSFISGGMIIDAQASFKVAALGESTIEMYSTSFFKKNVLTDSESVVERNRRVRENCRVKFQKSKYKISRRNQKEFFLENKIYFSLGLMYLREPIGVNEVFSERYGEMCKVLNEGNGVYSVELPIGSSLIYFYENGRCIKTETKGNLQDLIMKLEVK